ncbi:hypothetical protein [Rhodothermus profundi]|nr:hypothetical protein [Rhodothermus profundi]
MRTLELAMVGRQGRRKAPDPLMRDRCSHAARALAIPHRTITIPGVLRSDMAQIELRTREATA